MTSNFINKLEALKEDGKKKYQFNWLNPKNTKMTPIGCTPNYTQHDVACMKHGPTTTTILRTTTTTTTTIPTTHPPQNQHHVRCRSTTFTDALRFDCSPSTGFYGTAVCARQSRRDGDTLSIR